ncbi:MAG: substrate-binding domain-containing protein [Hyphomicrobiales bacterium]|nr:substrate-binding domain-containing protein [Hyphomicrobiales bacterium]
MKSFSRITAILTAFTTHEPVLRIDDLLRRAGVPQSSGYKLVNDLVATGLLRRVQRGSVALGPAGADFFFAPLRANAPVRAFTQATSLGDLKTSAAPRKSHLETELLKLVSTERFKKEPPFVIAFANASKAHPWRLAMEESLLAAARRQSDVVSKLIVYDAQDDAALQARQLADMPAQGVDLCILSAAAEDDAELENQLRLLAQQGFPIVGVDRRCGSLDNLVSFVTASDEMVGRVSALWLCEHLAGRGRILMLCGREHTSPCRIRLRAARQVFSSFPGIEIIAIEYTDWLAEKGYSIVGRYLDKGLIPDGVWSDSGLQGVGSLAVFRDRGFKRGTIPPHTGGELNLVYKIAVTEKVPLCGLDYPPAMGAGSFQVALSTLFGRQVPRVVETNLETIVTRGHETESVRADVHAERKVVWNRADDHVHAMGRRHGRGRRRNDSDD